MRARYKGDRKLRNVDSANKAMGPRVRSRSVLSLRGMSRSLLRSRLRAVMAETGPPTLPEAENYLRTSPVPLNGSRVKDMCMPD